MFDIVSEIVHIAHGSNWHDCVDAIAVVEGFFALEQGATEFARATVAGQLAALHLQNGLVLIQLCREKFVQFNIWMQAFDQLVSVSVQK